MNVFKDFVFISTAVIDVIEVLWFEVADVVFTWHVFSISHEGSEPLCDILEGWLIGKIGR